MSSTAASPGPKTEKSRKSPGPKPGCLMLLAFLGIFVVGAFSGAVLMSISDSDDQEEARKASAEAIATVLRGNETLLQKVNHPDRRGPTRLELVKTCIGQMQLLDTSACPDDFREAFFRYGKAWEAYGVQLQAHSDEQVGALLKCLLAMATGGAAGTGLLGPLLSEDPSGAEVNSAWTEVQAIAIRHGVRLATG